MSQAETRSFPVLETSWRRLPRGAPSLDSTPIAAGRQVTNCGTAQAINSPVKLRSLWSLGAEPEAISPFWRERSSRPASCTIRSALWETSFDTSYTADPVCAGLVVLRIGELATGCKEFVAVALEAVCATFEPINLRSLFRTFFDEVLL